MNVPLDPLFTRGPPYHLEIYATWYWATSDASAQLCGEISEIDIWRATRLMLKPAASRRSRKAPPEWRRSLATARTTAQRCGQTMGAVTQPANTSCRPARSTHRRNNWVYGVSGAPRGKRSRMTTFAPMRSSRGREGQAVGTMLIIAFSAASSIISLKRLIVLAPDPAAGSNGREVVISPSRSITRTGCSEPQPVTEHCTTNAFSPAHEVFGLVRVLSERLNTADPQCLSRGPGADTSMENPTLAPPPPSARGGLSDNRPVRVL